LLIGNHAARRSSDPGCQPVHRSLSFTRRTARDCRPDRDFKLFVRCTAKAN
jgi:hypothetical protein